MSLACGFEHRSEVGSNFRDIAQDTTGTTGPQESSPAGGVEGARVPSCTSLHNSRVRASSRCLVLLGLMLLASHAGCGQRESRSLGAQYPGAPVVVISIDTLRADRLPVYGYRRGSTPVLDRLGRDAIVFEDVYSHSPLTLPSHASLFTGLLPTHHAVRDNIGYTLKAAGRTLAARFKSAGYATGAAVSAYVLRRQTGIAEGFDFFDDAIEVAGSGESLSDTQRDGRLTIDALGAWIDRQADAKTFAFLHLYEPHTPYAAPPSHRMSDPYDGEVAYADELVGRLLDRVKARGWLDRAIVAIVSDHGEGLGDHGESEHGILLYREALQVPWILRLPGGAGAGRRVAGTLGLVDVAATLLDLAGLDAGGLDGQTVRPALAARTPVDRGVYSETLYPRLHLGWSDLASATEQKFRYIRAPLPELYDLSNDPGERQNVAASRTSTASALSAWIARTTADAKAAEPDPAPADVRERLKALGYVGSLSAPLSSSTAPLPDPKDHIAAFEALKRAIAVDRAGRTAEAIQLYREILASNPRMVDAWESLAKALVASGRMNEAIAAFGKALEVEPLKPEPHLALARIFALERQPSLARQHAELGTQRDPGQGYEILAELMMDAGRTDEAAAAARRSLQVDPSRYMSHYLLGVIAQQHARCTEAIGHFERAIEAKRLEPHAVVRNLHSALADCLARAGREADAEREFKAELAAIADSAEARVGLATLYKSQGRDAEARTVLAELVTRTPNPTADTYWTVVHTLRVLGDAAGAREWSARGREKFPRDSRFR
jgi:choline-sulfatase